MEGAKMEGAKVEGAKVEGAFDTERITFLYWQRVTIILSSRSHCLSPLIIHLTYTYNYLIKKIMNGSMVFYFLLGY